MQGRQLTSWCRQETGAGGGSLSRMHGPERGAGARVAGVSHCSHAPSFLLVQPSSLSQRTFHSGTAHAVRGCTGKCFPRAQRTLGKKQRR